MLFQFRWQKYHSKHIAVHLVHCCQSIHIQRDRDRIRLNVHLIEAQSGRTVWAERYDRLLTDIFKVQDELAERIVLTTSFRVPEAILTSAVRITAHELPGAAGKVKPAPGEGSVEVFRFGQQVEEAEWIASEIHQLNLEHDVPFNRMAVFTLPPEMIAPAWPMRLPAGAVTPAIYATTGLLTCR